MPKSPHRVSEAILAAAIAIVESEGMDALTMRRVATAVKLTPMALYNHFSNRNDLLNAVGDYGFQELTRQTAEARLTGDIPRKLATLLDVHLNFALKRQRLWQLMFLGPRNNVRQYPRDFNKKASPAGDAIAYVVSEGIAIGHFANINVWTVVFEVRALFQGLMILYFGGRVSLREKQFRNHCHKTFERYFKGLRV